MFEVQDTDLPNLIELKNISQSYDGGKNFIIKDEIINKFICNYNFMQLILTLVS